MRYSQKREIIKAAVINHRIHPTAEEVYNIVHKTNPEISMGTVYRNLGQLAEAGDIIKLSMADGPDRYDGTLEPHQHACCIKCGKIVDFDFDMKDMKDTIFEKSGIRPDSCMINVKGLCCQCADKIEKNIQS